MTATGFHDWALDGWRGRASCRSADPELFFPIGTTGPAVSQIEAAKAVCQACPVQAPCLEFALVTNQDSGVWGAASEDERRTLRKHGASRSRSQPAADPRASATSS